LNLSQKKRLTWTHWRDWNLYPK